MQWWCSHRPPPHAGAVGRPPRLTRRACGHRPVCPYLALLWSKGEAPPYLDSSSRQCSTTPLPPTTSLGSENHQTPAPYAPPPASSSPSRAPPRPGVPHRPLLSHRRAPLRPLTGALPSAEFTAAVSPHRRASLRAKAQIGFLLSGMCHDSFLSSPGCRPVGFHR
jgi:hypothetical protein